MAMTTSAVPGTGRPRVWTAQAVHELGLTTDVETAAQILGIGRTKAYELAQRGDFPATVVRVGRRYKVSVPALLRLLDAA
jgi:excisionase family DNA binding protein